MEGLKGKKQWFEFDTSVQNSGQPSHLPMRRKKEKTRVDPEQTFKGYYTTDVSQTRKSP